MSEIQDMPAHGPTRDEARRLPPYAPARSLRDCARMVMRGHIHADVISALVDPDRAWMTGTTRVHNA